MFSPAAWLSAANTHAQEDWDCDAIEDGVVSLCVCAAAPLGREGGEDEEDDATAVASEIGSEALVGGWVRHHQHASCTLDDTFGPFSGLEGLGVVHAHCRLRPPCTSRCCSCLSARSSGSETLTLTLPASLLCPGGLAAGILLRVQGGLLVSDALVCIMGLVLLSTGYGPVARLIEVRLRLRPHYSG